MKAKTLVIGGAGFIGSHVVERLLAAEYDVAVLDDLSSGKKENLPKDVPLFQEDITDADAVQSVFHSFKPNHVVHLAAQISVSRSVREPAFDSNVNVLGLLNVLENAAHRGVESFVFSSSGGVLYGNVHEPADEDHEVCPVSPYGIAKLTGEMYLEFFAAEYGLNCTALRYANVYGPRQDPYGEAGVVAIFLEHLLRGQAPVINGDGKYVRDYIYVKDVAEANFLALEHEAHGFRAYNVGTGIPTDVNELERKIRRSLVEVLKNRGIFMTLPEPRFGPPRAGDLRSSILDSKRIRDELGWVPRVKLDDGLKLTASWFLDRVIPTRTEDGTRRS